MLQNAIYLGVSEESTFGYQTAQYNCQLILRYFFPSPYDSAKYSDRKACLLNFISTKRTIPEVSSHSRESN